MNPWDLVKKQLELKLSPQSFQNWVSRTSLWQIDGETLVVSVPDEQTKTWMETEYAHEVLGMVRGLSMGLQVVAYRPEALRGMNESPRPAESSDLAAVVTQ